MSSLKKEQERKSLDRQMHRYLFCDQIKSVNYLSSFAACGGAVIFNSRD